MKRLGRCCCYHYQLPSQLTFCQRQRRSRKVDAAAEKKKALVCFRFKTRGNQPQISALSLTPDLFNAQPEPGGRGHELQLFTVFQAAHEHACGSEKSGRPAVISCRTTRQQPARPENTVNCSKRPKPEQRAAATVSLLLEIQKRCGTSWDCLDHNP